ncbi:hypothetical protein, partial [Nostoc sp. KVJ20]|uniref:hypothetical protein n=1 Tax=Nostoc sp. KVJ20 TaxID=457944 RepID=UPI001C407415
ESLVALGFAKAGCLVNLLVRFVGGKGIEISLPYPLNFNFITDCHQCLYDHIAPKGDGNGFFHKYKQLKTNLPLRA